MQYSIGCLLLGATLCLSGWATDNSGHYTLEGLLVACHCGDGQAVRTHLLKNPSLAQHIRSAGVPAERFTALDVAACGGYAEIVRLLLAAGADVNSRCCNARVTPLMQLCVRGRSRSAQVLTDLVEALAPPPAAAPSAPLQNTTATSRTDYLQCLRLVINGGADLDATDRQGDCALYYCAEQGDFEALSLLLAHGAKTDGWRSYKNDPLRAASFRGHLGCIQALMAAGCPVATGRQHGYSALNDAAQNGHVEILQHFLQQGLSANAESTPSGATPLLVAALKGRLTCMQLLLDAGAKVDHTDSNGCTALDCAAHAGQLQALELLLAHGANVHGWRLCKNDPLCAAAFRGHGPCVRALAAAGAEALGLFTHLPGRWL